MDLQTAIELIRSPHISAAKTTRWADLGSGSGLFTNALSKLLLPGSEILAVDKIKGPAIRGFPPEIRLQQLTLDFITDDLPFGDLDGILMANSFHYVRDKIAFSGKLRRLLNKTGILVIVEYDTMIPVQGWVPYPIDFMTLKAFFQNSGFGSVDKLAEYPSVFGTRMYAAIIRSKT